MAAIHETAYPRFKSHFEENELIKFYSPTSEEVVFSKKYTRSLESQFGLLTHLKIFQRLGYFVLCFVKTVVFLCFYAVRP